MYNGNRVFLFLTDMFIDVTTKVNGGIGVAELVGSLKQFRKWLFYLLFTAHPAPNYRQLQPLATYHISHL